MAREDPCLFNIEDSRTPAEEVAFGDAFDRDGMYDGDDEDDENSGRLSMDEDGAVVINVILNCRLHGRSSITHKAKLYSKDAFSRRFEQTQEDDEKSEFESRPRNLTVDL